MLAALSQSPATDECSRLNTSRRLSVLSRCENTHAPHNDEANATMRVVDTGGALQSTWDKAPRSIKLLAAPYPQLLQPLGRALKGRFLCDVVQKQRTVCTPVIRLGDGAVPLLSSCKDNRHPFRVSAAPAGVRGQSLGGTSRAHTCIPNLCFNGLAIHLHDVRRKLNTNSRLRVNIELVPGELRQQVRLSYS